MSAYWRRIFLEVLDELMYMQSPITDIMTPDEFNNERSTYRLQGSE